MSGGKIRILNLILENKPILFGRVTQECTVEKKVEKWKEIAEEAQQLGVMDVSKDWKFLRDPIWQNWRKGTVKKIEKRKQGGCVKRMNESDKIVLKILGRDKEGEAIAIDSSEKKLKLDTSEKILEMKLNILEKENYLKDLEIFQKEQELSLPPSSFTRHLYNVVQEDQQQSEIEENTPGFYKIDFN